MFRAPIATSLTPRRVTSGLIALAVALLASSAEGEKKPRPTAKPPAAAPAAVTPTLSQIDRARARLIPLHTRLGKPKPGDWLASQKEAGQTFAEYRRDHPTRQPRSRRTMYIQPIGPFSPSAERLIEATTGLLAAFYDAEVKRLPVVAGLSIPAEARRKNPLAGQQQILTTYVLEQMLIPARPKDATAVLALTATDLWPGEGWNFVFGQASLTERVGVWSIARYGNPAESDEAFRSCLLRTLKVATHETGHMLGIQHCTAYACGMNGSNSADEMDRNPLAFCPECSAKIWWACQVKPDDWLAALDAFGEKWELADQTAFWRRSREALED